MPKLYIANKNYSSWSLRPWILMTQLGLPFEEVLVPFAAPGEPGPFAAFSPSGKVPCLVDGDHVVWDSLSIVEYLAERSPLVWPSQEAPRVWARSASAEMHSGFSTLREICSMSCGVRVRLSAYSPALLTDIARVDQLWTDGLSRFAGPFLAGRAFTAVDAFFAPVVFRVQTYGLDMSDTSLAYVDRMLALPAMKRWYDEALVEPWRDESHEVQTRLVSTWVKDLRGVADGAS